MYSEKYFDVFRNCECSVLRKTNELRDCTELEQLVEQSG